MTASPFPSRIVKYSRTLDRLMSVVVKSFWKHVIPDAQMFQKSCRRFLLEVGRDVKRWELSYKSVERIIAMKIVCRRITTILMKIDDGSVLELENEENSPAQNEEAGQYRKWRKQLR